MSAFNSLEISKIINIVDDLEKSLKGDVNIIAIRQATFEKKVDVESLLRRLSRLESNESELKTRSLELNKKLEEAVQQITDLTSQVDTLRNRCLSLARSTSTTKDETKRKREESEEDTESEHEHESSSSSSSSLKDKKTKPPIGDSELFDFEIEVLLDDVAKFSERNRQQLLAHLDSFKTELNGLSPNCTEVNSKLLKELFSQYILTPHEQRQIQLDCYTIMTQDEPKGRGRPMASVGLHKRAKEISKKRKLMTISKSKKVKSSSSNSDFHAQEDEIKKDEPFVPEGAELHDEYGFLIK